MIADQLYKYFAGDITGYEKCKPETLFRKFIFNFQNIEKRLAAYGLGPGVPWLGGRKIIYRFV